MSDGDNSPSGFDNQLPHNEQDSFIDGIRICEYPSADFDEQPAVNAIEPDTHLTPLPLDILEPDNGMDTATGNNVEIKSKDLVRCPCGLFEEDGLMIQCAYCENWQHAVCFRLLKKRETPETHICERCFKNNKKNQPSLKSTDPSLDELTPSSIQATCIWRRALHALLYLKLITLPKLNDYVGVATPVSKGLLQRLQNEGYVDIVKKGKRTSNVVNLKRLKEHGLKKYFYASNLNRPLPDSAVRECENLSKTIAQSLPNAKKGSSIPSSKPSSSTGRKYFKQNALDCSEMDKLSKRTESLKMGSSQENKSVEEEYFKAPETRAKKRLLACHGENTFSISDSQESHLFPPAKKKSSVTGKNVLV